eukprot:gnl/TRDRNA2_/TRDRNA2_193834_c0_seq1.p1 gnl/TRDRNA2_/TRDRNA2_193834_c0~~gnl/TRDRNA2_/TRDRNA2_193834_c0_seq1.p1  ORF type:complete len:101 (-),score=14.54 gnl/TRDRNA2_/TRDRNA2_193834_c0_seq1:131-433(-)
MKTCTNQSIEHQHPHFSVKDNSLRDLPGVLILREDGHDGHARVDSDHQHIDVVRVSPSELGHELVRAYAVERLHSQDLARVQAGIVEEGIRDAEGLRGAA